MQGIPVEEMHYLCKSLSNALGLPVRILREEGFDAFYSVFRLSPDPASLLLDQLRAEPRPAGVLVSPLLQYYGWLTLPGGVRMVVGPTRADSADPRQLREYLFLLGVQPPAQEEYLHALGCLPVYSMGRVSWLVSFLSSIRLRRILPVEELARNFHAEDCRAGIQRGVSGSHAELEQISGTPDEVLLDNGYRFEKLLMTFVEQGQPERVRELMGAPPSMITGQLSRDDLRQAKNLGVCAAAIASRAAIAGGVDSRRAFRLSDLYIQQIELLRDVASVERIRTDIVADFAREVQQVRYRVAPDAGQDQGGLFVRCAEYVSQNIYAPIRPCEIAEALGYTRSYLCSRFRELADMTLTQYIQQEKVFEAQRLLRFGDQSLSQLAELLAFSSQSHFQNVFKKVTGETPAQYRRRAR